MAFWTYSQRTIPDLAINERQEFLELHQMNASSQFCISKKQKGEGRQNTQFSCNRYEAIATLAAATTSVARQSVSKAIPKAAISEEMHNVMNETARKRMNANFQFVVLVKVNL